MNRLVMAMVGGAAALAVSAPAAAAPPAWCKGAVARAPDLKQLSDLRGGRPVRLDENFLTGWTYTI